MKVNSFYILLIFFGLNLTAQEFCPVPPSDRSPASSPRGWTSGVVVDSTSSVQGTVSENTPGASARGWSSAYVVDKSSQGTDRPRANSVQPKGWTSGTVVEKSTLPQAQPISPVTTQSEETITEPAMTEAPAPVQAPPADMTEKNRKILEAVCPDCLNDQAYQSSLNNRKEILDHLPQVDSLLRNSAKNVMRVSHLNCNADQIFVPANYVSDIRYCLGGDEKCDRVKHSPTTVYADSELEKYKNDRALGDIYRTDLPRGASAKCQELHDKPFIFYVGGKAVYSQSQKSNGEPELNLFNSATYSGLTENKMNIYDCSSTINAIYGASGLKFSPKDQGRQGAYGKGTGELIHLAHDPKSCIKPVEFKASDSLHSGDVFILNRNVHGVKDINHSMMFDDVREDPFGLNEVGVKTKEDCQTKIDPRHFHFSIIQSSGTDIDRQVFERFKAIDLFVVQNYDLFDPKKLTCGEGHPNGCDLRMRFEDWGAHILLMAERACEAKITQKSVKPTDILQRTDVVAEENGGDKDPFYGEGLIFRHKGLDVPNCAFAKPPKLVGAECIGSCLEK